MGAAKGGSLYHQEALEFLAKYSPKDCGLVFWLVQSQEAKMHTAHKQVGALSNALNPQVKARQRA